MKTYWFVSYTYFGGTGNVGTGSCVLHVKNIIFDLTGACNDIKDKLINEGTSTDKVIITNFIQLTEEQIKVFEL